MNKMNGGQNSEDEDLDEEDLEDLEADLSDDSD